MAKNKINGLYTVILTNYNTDLCKIKEALLSVLNQTYQNIELIITDDGSSKFSKSEIDSFINKNKKNNIQKVDYIINKKNIGTTKTLNKAIKNSKGDYILFFASDDKLPSNNLLQRYVDIFSNKNKVNIITSQWIICDKKLKKIKNHLSKIQIIKYRLFPKLIMNDMLCSNKFGAGSTTYRKVVFEKYSIDEKYKLLEDWPFWLVLLKNKEKFYVVSFNGLLHRSNGISQNNEISESKIIFYKEMLSVFNKIILPDYYKYGFIKRFKILRSYYLHIKSYSHFSNFYKEYDNFNNYFRNDRIVKILWIIDKINPKILEKICILCRYNKIVVLTFMLTIIESLIIINTIISIHLLYILVLIYFVNYCILNYIYNLISFLERSFKIWKNFQ